MAQHQDLKRKGGSDPDHQMSRNHAPPPLSIEVPKMRDLPNKSNPWSDVQLPVDILLLTVEDCEFLACTAFLKNSFKSYHQNLGFVYFGTMGETGEEALKVALMKCYKGSSGPGGSQNVIKNAVMKLRPKAAFLVGSCQGINPERTKRGDVVVSSKLSTEQFTTPVRRNIGNLILFSAGGWNPPLKDPVGEETVQVHRDSDIFSGSQFITKQRRVSQSRVIAVETEGEGLFAAAHDMNIEWVIVKGISHFSDDSNTSDDSWKSFASIMAASVVSNMLNNPVVFKEWPHYEDLTAKNQPGKQMPDSVCLEECQKQLRSLYETSSKVRIIPWDQNSAVDIDKIYTDLSWVMDDRTPRGVIQKKLDHYTKIFAHREPRRAPKRILVYGQPGIGKTVFTKKATFDWSQQRYSQTLGAFDLVLLVRLRDVSNLQDVPSILRACEVLDSNGAISVDNLYDYICRHQENVLLILDGYDEYVYSSKNESPVFKIWKKSQLRDCCVVITSREMKAETLRNCSDAQFKIDGFNDERQEEFARRFLKDDNDIEEFFEYLWQHNLYELAQIPLLLLMLCLLWTKTTREELPKERADIFAQFMTTMFDHMCQKKSAEESVSAKDYSDELYALGRLAFEALLQGQLYFPVSQLPAGYSLIERLIEVGLFQVLNMASLNREKGVYFIHKSVQEYLAGNFLKEELTSKKAESTNSLLKLDSVKKIREMFEVLKFAVQLSEEAARDILIQLGMAAKKEELTEFKFENETLSQWDLSKEQIHFINVCNQLFFYCSAETRKNLFPTFLSSLGGVLVIDKKQLNVIVEEKLVQTTEKTPNYVFYNDDSYKSYTEQVFSNFVILLQQLKAVIVRSAGEKKASEFLSNSTWRRIDEFFLKKEENNTHLYFIAKIVKNERKEILFPCDIIKALISKQETTKKTNMNGDESSEESSSSCCSKRHGLSRVRRIEAWDVNRSEVELISEIMLFITAPHEILVWGEDGEVFDAEVTESLLRSIQVTHKLKKLTLCDINVTSSPAVELFINNLFKKAPNLEWLRMSCNPLLGAGVDSLIKHLSCAPHLKVLELLEVKMTPQQVMDLSSAIKQHGNITYLGSEYYDDKGNPKPEHKWPSEDYWKRHQDREGNPESEHEWLPEDFWKWLYPSLFSHSSNKSQPQKQQIPAETPLSIHDSPFPADDQDTVRRTFLAPPDPTVEPMLTEASIPTAHGSSHGLVPQVQYSEHFSLPDIHTHHHSAPSTIFTPRESLSTDPYLISGPGPSTVTQEEPIDEEMWPQTEIQDLPQVERVSLKEGLNLLSSPSKAYDEQGSLQEESPRRKQKAGKKRKVQEMMTEVPREIKAQGPEAKLAYRNALKTGKVKVYRARIMLIGQDRAGKTSLKKSFLGLPFDPEEDSTDGIEVDPSKFEVDIDQVKNWKRTDKKLSVSQFALDLAKMVAKEIQERGKDKEEDDEENGDDDYEKEGKKQKAKNSKLDYPDEDTNKQTKMGQSGLNSTGEPRLSKPPVVNSQMNQDTSRKARKETKTAAPAVELNIDATLPPEEFTDYLDQILKGLNLQTDATAVEHHMILDLWDFAGQQLYYASYPVFLSPRAVYMLVYDLSKGLNDLAQPCFKQGDRKIPLGNPNKETNMENLLSWLVSVSSICSSESEKAVKDQPHWRPPVFIVGTHADNFKQHQEDIDKIESQIKREIFENSQNVIRPIFSVDNTQGSSDRGVRALQKRMIEVLKQEPYMGEEIPIRWFNFEKVVKALVAKKVYHLNMEQLQTIIQKHCFIENKDEVATMLNFYHDLGVIVKHGNTVILQAEWLIKLFKQLITVRCFDGMEPRHCTLWKEMEKTGVLNMELVEHVFSEFCQQGVAKEDILKMMMKFGLIVQFALSPTEEKYFVPCQLRSPPDNVWIKELSPGDPCPLYLDFQQMGYVPHGLYLQLVSRCTKWCSTSGFKRPPKLYDGASMFFIGKELTHHMMLVCKKRFVKVVLKQIKRNDGSSCEPVSAKEVPFLVRTFLNEMMQNLPEALPWLKNVAYKLCVKCPYCLKVEKRCANHDQFPCHDERCLCLLTVAPDGSCEYCLESHLDEILPLPELKRWFPSGSEDSSIKDTSEVEVETLTVSQKRLPTSIRQFPDKEGYQVKEGIPSDDDLELLSVKVEKWKPLGRRLKLEAAELTALHQENEELSEKVFAMLIKWKQKNAFEATYRCLYDALCHKLVNRKDLAEEFCCRCSEPEG